jgi:hypothetical protein
MATCSTCGLSLAANALFCPVCGTRFTPATGPVATPAAAGLAPFPPDHSQSAYGEWSAAPLPTVHHRAGAQRHGRLAFWLFAIAGFTVFNAVQWINHQNLRMVIGLIATRQLTFLVYDRPNGGTILLAAAIVAGAVFAVLGLLVYQGQAWALLVAIILYGADLALFLVRIQLRDPMGLFFHALALGVLISGYSAIHQRRSLAQRPSAW